MSKHILIKFIRKLPIPTAALILFLPMIIGVILIFTPGIVEAASCGTGGTTWINTHTTDGRVSDTQSNNWGGGNVCLTVPDTTTTGGGAYTVQSQTVAWTGNVLAAPEIQIGCLSGYCSPNNGLDQTASASPNPKMTWSYSTSGADASSSAYDAEFNWAWSTDCTATDTNPATKTVIGVFLDAAYPAKNLLQSYVKLGLPNTGAVTITGEPGQWYVLHVEHGTGSTATYKALFATTSQITSTTNLPMGPFLTYIQNNQSGWTTDGTSFMPGNLCNRELDADTEIWEGGAGLAGNALGITGP